MPYPYNPNDMNPQSVFRGRHGLLMASFMGLACSSGTATPPSVEPGTAPESASPGGTPGETGSTPAPGVNPTGIPTTPAGSISPPNTEVDAVGLRTIPIQRSQSRVLSRLTNAQYVNASAALLALDASQFSTLLPDVAPNGGYANAGYAQSQPYDLIAGFDAVATAMTEGVSDWSALSNRYGGCMDASCLGDFVAAFGERAFRRPLTAEETAAFEPIFEAAAANGLAFEDTLSLLTRAFLQAPEFLYLFESAPLDDYQLAARLSFYVTDGPPDDELYADAKAGALDEERVGYHVDRLLATSGDKFARAFAYDYFNLRKTYQRTVDVDEATLTKLVESLTQTFAMLIESDSAIDTLLTARTFATNPETTTYLGKEGAGETITATDEDGFMGLLTHPAALIAMSNAYEGSMVSRGLFLAHQLLCIPPTPPPSRAFSPTDVSVELPPDPTQRDEAEARLKDSNCLGCHVQFEPYAFALNHWTGDGRFNADERLLDNGPVTTSLGDLTFSSYADFFPLLAKSAQFQRCTADHMIRYGVRHSNYDESVVDAVLAAAGATSSGVTFRQLIRAVVMQPLFSEQQL